MPSSLSRMTLICLKSNLLPLVLRRGNTWISSQQNGADTRTLFGAIMLSNSSRTRNFWLGVGRIRSFWIQLKAIDIACKRVLRTQSTKSKPAVALGWLMRRFQQNSGQLQCKWWQLCTTFFRVQALHLSKWVSRTTCTATPNSYYILLDALSLSNCRKSIVS